LADSVSDSNEPECATVGFCEIDPYCRTVLWRRWPGIPIHDDIRTYEGLPCDLMCGGFPCQDISHAGARKGISGTRSRLWSEYHRLIRRIRPAYALVENTAALTARGLFAVLGDLAEIGYDAEWHCISACAIGAPHTRERLFILAYPTGGDGKERLRPWSEELRTLSEGGHRSVRPDWLGTVERNARSGAGLPNRVDRTRAVGNSVNPVLVEQIGKMIMRREHEQARR
jgi:DNA (cytosine-5)-methyltransferase 1